MMKRLDKLILGVRQHSWIEKKKARGFDTPSEVRVLGGTIVEPRRRSTTMYDAGSLGVDVSLKETSREPATSDVAHLRSMGVPAGSVKGTSAGTCAPNSGGTLQGTARKLKL